MKKWTRIPREIKTIDSPTCPYCGSEDIYLQQHARSWLRIDSIDEQYGIAPGSITDEEVDDSAIMCGDCGREIVESDFFDDILREEMSTTIEYEIVRRQVSTYVDVQEPALEDSIYVQQERQAM